MSTINDVAKLARVAKATVSHCLNGTKYVSPEVKERVIEACQQLNYTPSLVASSLITKKTNIIGLFLGVEKKYEAFFSNLIKGILLSASDIGYKVLIYFSVDLEDLITNLNSSKSLIEGAIILAPSIHDFRIRLLTESHIPFVLIGRPKNEAKCAYIDVDNVTITFEITQHLIKLGHRGILFFDCAKGYTISIDRNLGFEQALKLYHIPKALCIVVHGDNEGAVAYGYLEKYLNSKFEYTAIIVPSDIAGAKVYDICAKKGFTIGKDISIAALGGYTIADSLYPKLTTMVQNYEEMERVCVQILQSQFSDIPPEPQYIRLNYEIIYTDSCGAVNL